MSDDRNVVAYTVGICAASVCAKEDVSREEIEREINGQHPTGISSPWQISEDAFASGEPNPTPCNQEPGRLHYLLEC